MAGHLVFSHIWIENETHVRESRKGGKTCIFMSTHGKNAELDPNLVRVPANFYLDSRINALNTNIVSLYSIFASHRQWLISLHSNEEIYFYVNILIKIV